MSDLGITAVNGFYLGWDERLKLIKDTGFDSVMLWWGPDETTDRAERVRLAEKNGLEIEQAHAKSDNINSLWLETDDGDVMADEIERQIEDCAALGVHILTGHLTSGINPPPVSETGIRRIERIINCAVKKNVTIAIENMRKPEHARYVLDNYNIDNIKFCYDCGHENYWTPDIDWMELYGDRTAAVHLHDNKGNSDSHLIPFDGTINWEKVIRSLNESSYNGRLIIEAEMNSSAMYTSVSFEEFLKKCYTRGVKLRKLYNK